MLVFLSIQPLPLLLMHLRSTFLQITTSSFKHGTSKVQLLPSNKLQAFFGTQKLLASLHSTFWFPYVIISSIPFDFKIVCSIHKKCKHLQSLLFLILGAHFQSLPHFFPFVTSLPYVFYYPLYFFIAFHVFNKHKVPTLVFSYFKNNFIA